MVRKICPCVFLLFTLILIGSWPWLFSTAALTLNAWWSPGNGAVLRSTVPYENLSDKSVLTEQPGIAKARAEEIADLLKSAGLSRVDIKITFRAEPEPAHGVDDW